MPQETPSQKYFKQVYNSFLNMQEHDGKAMARPSDNAPASQQIFDRAMLAAAEHFVTKTVESSGSHGAGASSYGIYFPHVDANGTVPKFPVGEIVKRADVPSYTAAVAEAEAIDHVMKKYAAGEAATASDAKVNVEGAHAALEKKYGALTVNQGGFVEQVGPIKKRLMETAGHAGTLPAMEQDVATTKNVGTEEEVRTKLGTLNMTILTAQSVNSYSGMKIDDKEKHMLEKRVKDVLNLNSDIAALGSDVRKDIKEALDGFKKVNIGENDAILGDEIKALNKILAPATVKNTNHR